jgi:hypothetical protein
MRSGGGDSTAKKGWSAEDQMLRCVFSAKKKVSVVFHGKISLFIGAVFERGVQSPNKTPEPTPRLGVVRSLFQGAKLRGNLRGVAHL